LRKLKLGIFGVGHLGKIHIKCIKNLPEMYDLVGFYDPDENVAQSVQEEFDIKRYTSQDELIADCEALDVVSTTGTHFDISKKVLENKKHLFVEKPVTEKYDQSIILKELGKTNDLIIQVGHVERFNPAFKAIEDWQLEPTYIEGERLGPYSTRGTDVSVIHDLMIHDIDLVLQLIKSPITEVRANGQSVLSNTPDVCNTRIEFANGAVANLTASRISPRKSRRLRIFQKETFLSLDFMNKKATKLEMVDPSVNGSGVYDIKTELGDKKYRFQEAYTGDTNAIQDEFAAFYQSIVNGQKVMVNIDDAGKALQLVERIVNQINTKTNKPTV